MNDKSDMPFEPIARQVMGVSEDKVIAAMQPLRMTDVLAADEKNDLAQKVWDGKELSPTEKHQIQLALFRSSEDRKFLPTLADLVDRLTIVQQKMIFIPENAAEYAQERADIEHDIDLILREKEIVLTATDIHAICMIQLTNRFIWENESKARAGGPEQDKLLKLTHSINGVRNTAKNALSRADSGRKDYKIDALAADLPPEFGNWKVFGV